MLEFANRLGHLTQQGLQLPKFFSRAQCALLVTCFGTLSEACLITFLVRLLMDGF